MIPYFVVMAGLAAVTLVVSIKDMAILILFLTLGFGFPLIYSASAFAYGLCAFPFFASDTLDWRKSLSSLGLSCALALTLAWAPSLLGRIDAEAIALSLRQSDFAPQAAVTAGSLEIRRPADANDEAFSGRDACGLECRGLLANGAVRWVRIVMTHESRERTPDSATRYELRRGDQCAVADAGNSGPAVCVVQADDDRTTAELTVVFGKKQFHPSGGSLLPLAQIGNSRSVLAFRDGTVEILRQTSADVEIPVAPALIGAAIRGMSSSGLDFMRRRETFNPLDMTTVAEKLGLSLKLAQGQSAAPAPPRDWRAGVTDSMTRELVSVLDLKQAEPFNAQQAQPINDWVMQARNITQWTPEGLALLRRIVRDRRLKSPSFFDQIFERHADVTAALLPDVLDMTQQDGAGSQLTPARQAVYTFPRLDPALLKPHAGQIIGLLARDKNTREALLPVVGRLGVDPLPYLLPFEDDWKSSAFAARVRGACYAEPQWAPELIAALRRFADAAAQQGPKELQKIMPALQALAHLGDGDYVDQYLAKADEQRFRRRIHNELADKRRPDTLCWFY